ncbi:hypothetical protein D4Q80_01350 [bacterium]|nr:MAG: hypothetical protein D4Q80_01350 [bacterium]
MKKIICIFSTLIVISFLLSGCVGILSDIVVNKGVDNILKWATNNVSIGAAEDEILQHLGPPRSKDNNVWVYAVPERYSSLNDSTTVVFFSDKKVVTWLGYYGNRVTGVAQSNYHSVSIGDSQEKVIKDLGEPAYKGFNIWLFWKEPVIKYTFWDSPPVENTMQAIIVHEEKVVGILCFRSFEYYGKPYNLHLGMIIPPTKDLEYAKERLKQFKKK